MHPFEILESGLGELAAAALTRRRRIADTPCGAHMRFDEGREILAFASNDYLGLANHPRLVAALAEGARRYGVGSGGSHLLGGHSRAHERLEDTLAEWVGGFVDAPRALSFSTGYMANLAILSALGERGATIFSDSLNHASLIDGARLSRAEIQIYPHADANALAAMLAATAPDTVKIIVTDGVFSMDGDIAPLPALVALAERHQAWLVVDDAHGFGVLGADGAGSLAHYGLRSPYLINMATLGKAAGTAGAFVVAHGTVIEWLIQRARPYIFTTAAAPALAHASCESIALMRGAEGQARRAHLQTLIAATRAMLTHTRWLTLDSPTAIQPLVIGTNEAALALAETLLEQGFWVPALRPPTVPAGTARLRLSLSAAHSSADLERLAAALHKADQDNPAVPAAVASAREQTR